ncbi:MAG TPA: 4-alpha-glucanotransferase [Bacteroidetes bacterium]|nr:4-alpha-glucanotransferase [bacterium BMS3Bbin04]HDO64740.1 4-alpha-glucanotransferase [Bacteroidota bacterium]HEX03865.1 4-alpha-glucanotransferase [Bacteroidota bacterium]
MNTETRQAGVLLHPTSLPGPNGIGELGSQATDFVDWLVDGEQTIWQVMPLGPTGYGDSPYQCFSAFAANPLLISLDRLQAEGLLNQADLEPLSKLSSKYVDFGAVIPMKNDLLKQAFTVFQNDADPEARADFDQFKARFHFWLEDFALFKALKEFYAGQSWNEWPVELRDRDFDAIDRVSEELASSIEFHSWLQYKTISQWWAVRHYAQKNGVQILGDLPIFVAYDSADAWANRQLFHFDDQGNPTVVAGVPPDYFSETGQLWGNPLYKWEAHRDQGFSWWEARLKSTFEMVDMVRIDHFRGFEACWEVPADEETAINGQWVKAPGYELFGTLRARMGQMNVVAENLGVITDEVENLRRQFHFPGMRVLQFAWDSGPMNAFLPHNHSCDSVIYTGTHDNNTTRGWFEQEATKKGLAYLKEYVGHELGEIEDEFVRMAYASSGLYAIIPMQDWLKLGSEARMNTPGNASGNWSWRVDSDQLSKELSDKMRELTQRYGRAPSVQIKEEEA